MNMASHIWHLANAAFLFSASPPLEYKCEGFSFGGVGVQYWLRPCCSSAYTPTQIHTYGGGVLTWVSRAKGANK